MATGNSRYWPQVVADVALSAVIVSLAVLVVAWCWRGVRSCLQAPPEVALLSEARKQTDAHRRAAIAQERQAKVLEATMRGFGK